MSKIFIAIFFFLFSIKVIFNILNEKAKTEDRSTYHGFLYFQRWLPNMSSAHTFCFLPLLQLVRMKKVKGLSFFKIYNSKFDILIQSSFINLDSSWSKMKTSKFSWTHACLYILLQNEGREKKRKRYAPFSQQTIDYWKHNENILVMITYLKKNKMSCSKSITGCSRNMLVQVNNMLLSQEHAEAEVSRDVHVILLVLGRIF